MAVKRLISFRFSAEIAYVMEFGEGYIRFYYNDVEITQIDTDYAEEHLYELFMEQVGDVVRITHPFYPPQTLKRVTAYEFTIADTVFSTGPFLTRNDLLDPLDLSPNTMAYAGTLTPGSTGTLTAGAAYFEADHAGSLFKLTHARATKVLSTTAAIEVGESTAFYAKGAMNLITRGTWTGTVTYYRSVNGAAWEMFRQYKGAGDRNVQLSWVENDDNVKYKITPTAGMSSTFATELSVDDPYSSGIVRVISVGSTTVAAVEVITRIDSTAATRMWAEGSWGAFRGYPATISFFEDRCCYAGTLSGSEAAFGNEIDYPSLRGVP